MSEPLFEPAPEVGPVERRVREQLTAALARAVEGLPDPSAPPPPPPSEAKAVPLDGKPITFSAAMVRALLAGNKSQTRRLIRPIPAGSMQHRGQLWPTTASGEPMVCRLAKVGQELWVREPWTYATGGGRRRYEYEADTGDKAASRRRWRPGRFMARDASRLVLRVTKVFPQRLQELTPDDAVAEGMPPGLFDDEPEAAIAWFQRLWDSVYGKGEFAWEHNPWVWVIRFRVVLREDAPS